MNFYLRDCLKESVFERIPKDFIFEKDNFYLNKIRKNINEFIDFTSQNYIDQNILEIGPVKFEPNPLFTKMNKVDTVDICQNPKTTYVSDITKENNIKKNYYDVIYCLEVLEHTFEPESGLKEMYKMLKKNGILHISVPFQFRIHGPIPDCYRISEYGWKYLLEKNNFEIIFMDALIDNERPAFPLHYRITCKKI